MTALLNNDATLRDILVGLVDSARSSMVLDRRETFRERFFAPVLICDLETSQTIESALSVDISTLGTRLVFSGEPLDTGEYLLILQCDNRPPLSIRSSLEWCDSLSGGWYSSGFKFIQLNQD